MIYKPTGALSFLTSPKPWSGIAAQQQENAVRNWQSLHPENEVILYGNAPGTGAACQRLGVTHVPDVAGTPSGIPYFGAIAEHATRNARHEVQVYLNCDILLRHDLLAAVAHIQWAKFLLIGQRVDLAEACTFDLTAVSWLQELRIMYQNGRATLHPPAGSDYFVFKRGMWSKLPHVVIGRGGYDNALIAFCLRNRTPVIDGTFAVPAIHQFHDYNHVPSGASEIFSGKEALINQAAIPDIEGISLEDADWLLKHARLIKNVCRGDWGRRLVVWSRHVVNSSSLGIGASILRRVACRLGLSRARQPTLHDLLSHWEAEGV